MLMSTSSIFVINKEYVFIVGSVSSFYPKKIEKNVFGHFILGKFIEYKDILLHGDIIPEAKAIFENGTVDCNQYHNIVNTEFAHKKNV